MSRATLRPGRRVAVAGTLAAVAAAIGVATGFASPSATAPHNTALPTVTGSTHAGDVLTANPGTWTGDAPITYAYAWQRCDSSGFGCQEAPNGRGQTYIVGTAAIGTTFRVVVTATNAGGTTDVLSPSTPIVTAAPAGRPASTSPPTVIGTLVTGSVLTATPGAWTGAQPIAYAYTWERCDGNGGACRPVATGNQPTYELADADAGATIRVTVTAKNAGGTQTATSVPSGKVAAAQAGIVPLPAGQKSISATTLALPNRLVIEHVSFAPSSLATRDPFKVTVRVRDTRGYLIRDAKVFILGVPYSRVATVPEGTTGQDGTATFDVRPLEGLPITIKDSIASEGVRSTDGMKMLEHNVPERDAPQVSDPTREIHGALSDNYLRAFLRYGFRARGAGSRRGCGTCRRSRRTRRARPR